MDKTLSSLNWSLIQAFLAVAEGGSLSQAARDLGTSQPTLGRQIKQIETELGLSLFKRQPRGFDLTQAGQSLLGPAQQMQRAMNDISLYAAGRATDMRGTVRVTTSDMMAHHILPRIIADIRRKAPEISVELVATDATENLLFREADIAVRLYRPEQLDIVARHVGDIELALFASHDYIAARGTPATGADFMGHDLVGYDRSELLLRGMRAAGWDVTRDMFQTRCDSQTAYWELVRAGCGIGFGQAIVGRNDPRMCEIDFGVKIPPLPVWLAAHQAMRQTPRISYVWQQLAEGLGAVVS